MRYSIFCGDVKITEISFKAKNPQALSKEEQESIRTKASATHQYKEFNNWLGFGFVTIKLNY